MWNNHTKINESWEIKLIAQKMNHWIKNDKITESYEKVHVKKNKS